MTHADRDPHYRTTRKQKIKTQHNSNPNTAATKIKKRSRATYFEIRGRDRIHKRKPRVRFRSTRHAIRTREDSSQTIYHMWFVVCHVLLLSIVDTKSAPTARTITPGNSSPDPFHPTLASDHMSIARTVPYRLAVRTCTVPR